MYIFNMKVYKGYTRTCAYYSFPSKPTQSSGYNTRDDTITITRVLTK